jgi:peptidyl-prolyl cis-trans isomerase B (cyclophilin B)
MNAPKEQKEARGSDMVVFETSAGDFEVELYADKAPITVENFLSYVKDAFFDGLIFHRVIDGFMIQGGGFDENMNQKPTKAPITNEAGNGLKNEKYTIAMARTNVVNSATAQFFINVEDNDFLDHRDESPAGFGYAVFGKVVSGTATIDKIKGVKTTTKGYYEDVPAEPVIITRAFIKE